MPPHLAQLQLRHNELCWASPAYNKLMRALFLTPNPVRPSVPASAEVTAIVETIRQDGIALLPWRCDAFAEYLQERYLRPKRDHRLDFAQTDAVDMLTPADQMTGLTIYLELSLRDHAIRDFFLDERLCAVLYNYYRRQPYYRNLPTLAELSVGATSEHEATQKFHIDRNLHQVSIMMLASDVAPDSTRMQYAIGSHRHAVPHRKNINRYSFPDSEIIERYPIRDLVGPKGSVYLFDAGNGFHRALPRPGTTRCILHMNITTGYYLPIHQRRTARDGLGDISHKPAFVRRMLRKVVSPSSGGTP